MSGAGKSRAAICLEDSGYYIVDNLPAEMMVKFAEFCAAAGGRYDRLAFVYDVRAGEPFERLTGAVEELRRRGLRCRLLFLEADTKTIINRYKETRRSHPSRRRQRGRGRCWRRCGRRQTWCWIHLPSPQPSCGARC